jgi:predicted ABC-class ATPase
MLKRLDRALGLVQHRARLAVREVEQELQHQHLLLLEREVLDQLEHAAPADRLQRGLLRRRLGGAFGLRHLLLRLPAPRRAEVVHREVVGDPKEPRGERGRAPAEPPDRLQHLQERLRRQVLGVVPVPDAHVQVAVDAIEMEQIERLQRLAVALLGELDQAPQVVRAAPSSGTGTH